MTTHPLFNPTTVERLLTNSEPWLSCDDCFDGSDVVVEAFITSDAPLDERFRTHFAACPVCREEAESLAALLALDHSLDPQQVGDRLDAAISRRET